MLLAGIIKYFFSFQSHIDKYPIKYFGILTLILKIKMFMPARIEQGIRGQRAGRGISEFIMMGVPEL